MMGPKNRKLEEKKRAAQDRSGLAKGN